MNQERIWDALLDAILDERPSEGLSLLRASQAEVASGGNIVDLDVALGEDLDLLRREHVLVVAQTELSSLVASPAHQLTGLLDEQHASVLSSYCLLDSHASLILDLDLLLVVENVVQGNVGVFDAALVDDDLVDLGRLSALPVVVPAPDEHLALAVDSH